MLPIKASNFFVITQPLFLAESNQNFIRIFQTFISPMCVPQGMLSLQILCGGGPCYQYAFICNKPQPWKKILLQYSFLTVTQKKCCSVLHCVACFLWGHLKQIAIHFTLVQQIMLCCINVNSQPSPALHWVPLGTIDTGDHLAGADNSNMGGSGDWCSQ